MSAETGPSVDNKHVQESHFCNSCSSQKETNTISRCSRCKARWYCSKTCQTTDWETHKTIQALAIKYEEADLGRGHGDDPHAFKTHLTPKQQDKLIKLVGRKCQVRCKVNGVELTALWKTGAQISLLSKKQLKEHFGDVEIQDVKLSLDDGTEFELTTANRTQIPSCGWVKLNFQLSSSEIIEVPMLVTEYQLDLPIIGYNVIDELLKTFDSSDTDTGVTDANFSLLLGSFKETSLSNIKA